MTRFRVRAWLAGSLALASLAPATAQPRAPIALDRGESHDIPISLGAGDHLHVAVRQIDADLTLELVDPFGEGLQQVDDRTTNEGLEELRYLAPSSGVYRLFVATRWKEPGSLRIETLAHGPPSPIDRRRAEADMVYREAKKARRTADADLEAAVARLREVREDFEALNLRARAVDTLIEESILLNRLGRTEESVALLEETLRDSRRRGDALGETRALTSLGVRRYQAGDLRGAAARTEEAVQALKGVDDPLVAAKVQLNLGLYLSFAGRNRESLEHYRIGGDLAAEIGWLDGEATAWFNASLAHSGLRNYRKAFEHLRRADSLFARVGKPVDQGRMRMNEGVHFLNLGEPQRAAERFRQALAVLPAGETAERARAFQNLGQVALWLGDLSGARIHTERCLEALRGLEDPKLEGTALGVLSEIDLAQGRLEEGLAHAKEAVEVARASGVERILPAALVALAEAARYRRDFDDARTALGEALELAATNRDPMALASAHLSWARLARDRGDLPRALQELDAGIAAVETVRDRAPTLELQATLLSRFRELFDLAIEIRHELEIREPGAGHAATAFQLAERARARSLLDSLPALAWRTDETSVRLRELGVELGEARDALAAARGDTETSSTELRETSRRLDLAIAAYEGARVAWIEAHPHEKDRLEWRPADLTQVQAALPGSALLLEYHVGRDSSFLFVVGTNRFELVPLGSTADLKREVEELTGLLVHPSVLGAVRYRDAARDVFARVVQPALRGREAVRHLYVSPDGPLRNIPFAALVRSNRGTRYEQLDYLGNEHVLSYLPSAAVGLELRKRRIIPSADAATLVAFGDPSPLDPGIAVAAVRSVDLPDLGPLPAARNEVESLAGIVERSIAWIGEDATEARFHRLIDRPPRWIHLATHASIDRWRPDLSWLQLAPAEGHDGYLEAWEVATLHLPVEQVVLAACGSALGRPVAGEGLIGLVQAFFDAGARTVVASLWPVPDRGTSKLMFDFYRELNRSSASEALAAARRAQITRGGPTAHPYYWASFVLSGWDEPAAQAANR